MTPDQTAIVTLARAWVGTPYHHGASRRGIGTDCLGLIRGVYEDHMGHAAAEPMPYSRDWAEFSGEEILLAAARRHLIALDHKVPATGLVLAFRWRRHLPAKHLAIATAETSMVHAIEGAAVAETAITPWWRRHIAGVFSFPERPL